MYGHINTGILGDSPPSDIMGFCQAQPWPSHHHPLAPLELSSASETHAVMSHWEAANSSSSGHNSPCSLASSNFQGQSVMQRSVSSHNGFLGHFPELVDDIEPVRRAFSAGDLHRTQRPESPLWSESNAIIEGMNRACRYGPEEKRERIERYKSKRNLRNFNKRIKYVCRKTLADSRPRIRGRFARNDEIEKNPQAEWNQGAEEDEDDDAWINFLHSLSANQFLNL